MHGFYHKTALYISIKAWPAPFFQESAMSPCAFFDIYFIYISNAIPKVSHTLPPTHPHFLALVFPCTGAYKVCVSNGPLFPVMAN